MLTYTIIVYFLILPVVFGNCPPVMKYLVKELGSRHIDTAAIVPSFMHCIETCLRNPDCDAVTFNHSQCTPYSTSTSFKVGVSAFHVRSISWPQRLEKQERNRYGTTLPVTHTSCLTTTTTTITPKPLTLTTTPPSPPATTRPTPPTTTNPTTTTTKPTTLPTTTRPTPPPTTNPTTTTTKPTTPPPTATRPPPPPPTTTTTTITTITKTTTTKPSTVATSTTTSAGRVMTKETCPKHGSGKYAYLQDSGMCIRFVEKKRVSWNGARSICRVDGGDLAKLDTEKKYDSCYKFIKQIGKGGFGSFAVFSSRVWIGLRASKTGGQWVDGSPMNYTKTENIKSTSLRCVQMGRGFLKTWFDQDCDSVSEMSLCEIS